MIKKTLLATTLALAATSANAVIISFQAYNLHGLGNSLGNDLASGSLVELGTWNGSSFATISTSSIDIGNPGAFTGLTGNLNTTGYVGAQLALRWTDSISSSYGLAYMDKSINSAWSVVAGDGTGLDTATMSIDISDLADLVDPMDPSSSVLLPGATIIAGSFSGSSVTFGGTPLFMTAIPEPSTYAALAGALALGLVAWKRRRA